MARLYGTLAQPFLATLGSAIHHIEKYLHVVIAMRTVINKVYFDSSGCPCGRNVELRVPPD